MNSEAGLSSLGQRELAEQSWWSRIKWNLMERSSAALEERQLITPNNEPIKPAHQFNLLHSLVVHSTKWIFFAWLILLLEKIKIKIYIITILDLINELLVIGFKLVAAAIASNAFTGVAIGVGFIFASLVYSISRNPSQRDELLRFSFIGFSLVEASGLIGLVMSFLLLFGL